MYYICDPVIIPEIHSFFIIISIVLSYHVLITQIIKYFNFMRRFIQINGKRGLVKLRIISFLVKCKIKKLISRKYFKYCLTRFNKFISIQESKSRFHYIFFGVMKYVLLAFVCCLIFRFIFGPFSDFWFDVLDNHVTPEDQLSMRKSPRSLAEYHRIKNRNKAGNNDPKKTVLLLMVLKQTLIQKPAKKE